MKKTILLALIMTIAALSSAQNDFVGEQKKYARVRHAFEEKEDLLAQTLSKLALSLTDINILIVAYKDTDELELYVKSRSETNYRIAATYRICARSGSLGPKRKQGDYQVPEGFYSINRYNPASSFHLSLGLDYPNPADKKKSTFANLGGDIFIHGSCVTIGCLPMTDDIIKELYLYAIHARNNGQTRIPVYIFPFRMTDANLAAYKTRYRHDASLTSFWENLKPGYDQFMEHKTELRIQYADNGDYLFR